jgi:hypothetical protein
MNLSVHNQALLRGIMVSAVVLSGASGCSRSDRAGAGRDTTQTSASATQPSAGASTQPSGDTAMTTTRDTARATAQTPTSPQPSRPSNRRIRPDTTVKSGAEAVSGYRGMERDSSAQPEPSAATRNTGDSAGVSSDSSVSASPDTTSAEVAGTGAATHWTRLA